MLAAGDLGDLLGLLLGLCARAQEGGGARPAAITTENAVPNASAT
jgi:hypothetical protein